MKYYLFILFLVSFKLLAQTESTIKKSGFVENFVVGTPTTMITGLGSFKLFYLDKRKVNLLKPTILSAAMSNSPQLDYLKIYADDFVNEKKST